ncbi:MAG TPA: hypothetical protein VII63_04330 [Caulobacteraceae bacterium]
MAAAIAASPPQGGVLPDERRTYDAMLAAQVRAANNTFTGSACDTAKVEVVSITPWKITDHPEWIVWRERVRVTGCGHSSIENVNMGRMGGTPLWRMTTGLPGESLADMPLQESTYPAAGAEARDDLPPDCQGVTLNDVYVAARAGGVDLLLPGVPLPGVRTGRPAVGLPETARPFLDKLALSDAWMEVWPFEVCGHDRTLGVVFIPLKDQSATVHLFLPIWQHGPGARPHPAPAAE